MTATPLSLVEPDMEISPIRFPKGNFLHRWLCPSRAAGRARELRRFYHRLLQDYYQRIVPAGQRVLELGCGLGDLLAAVQPSLGVGVDFSQEMLQCARQGVTRVRHVGYSNRLKAELRQALEQNLHFSPSVP